MKKIRFANAEKQVDLAKFSAKASKIYFGYHDKHEYPYSSFTIRADYIDCRDYDNLKFGRISTTVAQNCVSVYFFDSMREIRLATTCYDELFILAKAASENSQRFAFTDLKTFDIGSTITFEELVQNYKSLYSKTLYRKIKTAIIKDSVNVFGNIWAIITNDCDDFILIQSL